MQSKFGAGEGCETAGGSDSGYDSQDAPEPSPPPSRRPSPGARERGGRTHDSRDVCHERGETNLRNCRRPLGAIHKLCMMSGMQQLLFTFRRTNARAASSHSEREPNGIVLTVPLCSLGLG